MSHQQHTPPSVLIAGFVIERDAVSWFITVLGLRHAPHDQIRNTLRVRSSLSLWIWLGFRGRIQPKKYQEELHKYNHSSGLVPSSAKNLQLDPVLLCLPAGVSQKATPSILAFASLGAQIPPGRLGRNVIHQ